jgi:hypothetical protein
VSLIDQMLWVDRLVRRPADLDAARALDPSDAQVLATIDPTRLLAVNRTHATLVVARWWQARFPAVLATLNHFCGGAQEAACALFGDPAFEHAEGEDVDAAAFVAAVTRLTESADVPWLPDLLAYEYLIGTGLPRRARGEPVSEATEATLLPDAVWLEGGRLRSRILLCPFTWPVSELQDEPHDADPAPHTLLFAPSPEGALEVETGDDLADALELVSSGTDDVVIGEAFGPEVLEALDQLVQLGVVDP